MAITTSSEFLKQLKKSAQSFYIIHYSCQSLFDDNDGLSPRITSVSIQHLSTNQAISFSTHAIAEELKIEREFIHKNLDSIETELLNRLNNFISERRDHYWVHWNMRNLSYGFEHIEHRYRVLGGANMSIIPVERRINLNDMLLEHFGDGYVEHPRLQKLMDLNGGVHRDFLSGSEEVEAFKNNEFIKLHKSTLCKTGFYVRVINKILKGELNTNSNRFGVFVDRLLESRLSKLIALFSAIFSIAYALYQKFFCV